MVASDCALVQAAARWTETGLVALDTEFERSRTFYPRPGLVQVADGETIWLLDPLALTTFEPLFQVLSDTRTLKVIHSCSEDLEVFSRLGAARLEPLFDTQVAAAFAGYGFTVGYGTLVETVSQVHLPKAETRSDWLRRPLTDKQRRYAALDVAYLLPLYRSLSDTIAKNGREKWLKEDCTRLTIPTEGVPPKAEISARMRRASGFNRRELAILASLDLWREEQARARDLPRRFVLSDAVLAELAKRAPTTLHELGKIPDMPPGEIRRSGKLIVGVISDVLCTPTHRLPNPPPRPPFPRAYSQMLSKLKSIVRSTAAALNLPAELLVPNRVLEALLWRRQMDGADYIPEELRGWRQTVIGQRLLDACDNFAGDACGDMPVSIPE